MPTRARRDPSTSNAEPNTNFNANAIIDSNPSPVTNTNTSGDRRRNWNRASANTARGAADGGAESTRVRVRFARSVAVRAVGAAALAALARVPARASDTITVFAAASLREAFEAVAYDFTLRSGTAVRFNFGGSDTLVTQLAQGAPADVFASANETQMKRAADAGLLAGAALPLVRNRIVVVVPRAPRVRIDRLADLIRPGTRVVLAARSVPVGAYARATFDKLAGRNGFPTDFAASVERSVVSNELDVKAVLAKVALGEADAGVVYATDIIPAQERAVRAIAFPADVTPDIIYPIARLRGSANATAADAFIAYVRGPGSAALRSRGFLKP